MSKSFTDLPQGYIYLVKGTLNQFAYEIQKLSNVEVILDPDWLNIHERISSSSLFAQHTYLVIFNKGKTPTNLSINNDKCYTLFLLISEFNGELVEHKKLFKSCHAPYFNIDILNKNYLEGKVLEPNLSSEDKLYLNLNPKNSLTNKIIEPELDFNLVNTFITGSLSLWQRSNRSIFYKYILTNNSCKYNYAPLSKSPYGIPISLWVLFIIYCKEKSKVYNLHPEYLIKVFAVWVYLTTNYYKTNLVEGLTSFINKKDKKIYYSFATNSQAMLGLKKIIKKC